MAPNSISEPCATNKRPTPRGQRGWILFLALLIVPVFGSNDTFDMNITFPSNLTIGTNGSIDTVANSTSTIFPNSSTSAANSSETLKNGTSRPAITSFFNSRKAGSFSIDANLNCIPNVTEAWNFEIGATSTPTIQLAMDQPFCISTGKYSMWYLSNATWSAFMNGDGFVRPALETFNISNLPLLDQFIFSSDTSKAVGIYAAIKGDSNLTRVGTGSAHFRAWRGGELRLFRVDEMFSCQFFSSRVESTLFVDATAPSVQTSRTGSVSITIVGSKLPLSLSTSTRFSGTSTESVLWFSSSSLSVKTPRPSSRAQFLSVSLTNALEMSLTRALSFDDPSVNAAFTSLETTIAVSNFRVNPRHTSVLTAPISGEPPILLTSGQSFELRGADASPGDDRCFFVETSKCMVLFEFSGYNFSFGSLVGFIDGAYQSLAAPQGKSTRFIAWASGELKVLPWVYPKSTSPSAPANDVDILVTVSESQRSSTAPLTGAVSVTLLGTGFATSACLRTGASATVASLWSSSSSVSGKVSGSSSTLLQPISVTVETIMSAVGSLGYPDPTLDTLFRQNGPSTGGVSVTIVSYSILSASDRTAQATIGHEMPFEVTTWLSSSDVKCRSLRGSLALASTVLSVPSVSVEKDSEFTYDSVPCALSCDCNGGSWKWTFDVNCRLHCLSSEPLCEDSAGVITSPMEETAPPVVTNAMVRTTTKKVTTTSRSTTSRIMTTNRPSSTALASDPETSNEDVPSTTEPGLEVVVETSIASISEGGECSVSPSLVPSSGFTSSLTIASAERCSLLNLTLASNHSIVVSVVNSVATARFDLAGTYSVVATCNEIQTVCNQNIFASPLSNKVSMRLLDELPPTTSDIAIYKDNLAGGLSAALQLDTREQIMNFVLRSGSVIAEFSLGQAAPNRPSPAELVSLLLIAAANGSLARSSGLSSLAAISVADVGQTLMTATQTTSPIAVVETPVVSPRETNAPNTLLAFGIGLGGLVILVVAAVLIWQFLRERSRRAALGKGLMKGAPLNVSVPALASPPKSILRNSNPDTSKFGV